MPQDHLFYVGQKAFIRKDDAVLIMDDLQYGLDFPGGRIQSGEGDFVKALQREVMEETGLTISVGDPFFAWYNKRANVYVVGFACEYVSGEVMLSNQHKGFSWVDATSYKTLDHNNLYFPAIEKYFSKK